MLYQPNEARCFECEKCGKPIAQEDELESTRFCRDCLASADHDRQEAEAEREDSGVTFADGESLAAKFRATVGTMEVKPCQ